MNKLLKKIKQFFKTNSSVVTIVSKKLPQGNAKDVLKEPPKLNLKSLHCPIFERTGDGFGVGRCWYHCPNGICPRHGNVIEPLRKYHNEGKLTDELNWRDEQKNRGG